MNEHTLVIQLNQLCADLSVWESTHFQSEIARIKEQKRDLEQKFDRFSTEEQTLSIGIIGQVKAGKSSFLNALLFNGHAVLPEAATPKTANLTKISYGEQPLLEVQYYTPQEWAEIERVAATDGTHDEANVARELVGMIKGKNVDIAAILAKQKDRLAAADVTGLMAMMNDYVGENGRYTALVKATHLFFPIEDLKGFHVVDTPGMNDPVQSRTQHTKEYMASCDVVFFLSRSAQFLDQSDMDLLMRQLPAKGVKRMVLVAGQFDSALIDDGYDRVSLAATEENIRSRNLRRASEEIEKMAVQREQQGEHYNDIVALMRSMKSPIIASTFAHGFTNFPQERWGTSMLHVHKQFDTLVRECWNGAAITHQDWQRIANFDALTNAYQTARADKQALIAAQRQGIIPEALRNMQENVQHLIETVESRALQLRKGELSELEHAQTECQKRIRRIADRLAEEVNKTHSKAEAKRRSMMTELQAGKVESSKLDSRTGTEAIERWREVSTSSWYKPWTWGDTRREYYTTSRRYEYLATSDAVEQVISYSKESTANLQRAFNQVVNPVDLKSSLRVTLLKEFDTSDAGFDPGHFRRVLSETLDRLVLPDLQLNLENTTDAITQNFSGEARGDDSVNKLRLALQRALEDVFTRLSKDFDTQVTALCKKLEVISNSLADKLSEDLHTELNELRTAFSDKENELKTLDNILFVTRKYVSDSFSR